MLISPISISLISTPVEKSETCLQTMNTFSMKIIAKKITMKIIIKKTKYDEDEKEGVEYNDEKESSEDEDDDEDDGEETRKTGKKKKKERGKEMFRLFSWG